MPTIKQKKLAKELIKNAAAGMPRTQGEILESIGYSKNTAKAIGGEIVNAEGTRQALAELGYQDKFKQEISDELLIKVHKEGLAAYRVHSSMTEPDQVVPDFQTRYKYLELANKIGGYLIEQKTPPNLNIIQINLSEDKIKEINELALDE